MKRTKALSVSELNERFLYNISKASAELSLRKRLAVYLDFKIYLNDGSKFRAIECIGGDSSFTGYFIPSQFVTDRNNRYVGDFMRYFKLSTTQKKELVDWLSSKKFNLYTNDGIYFVAEEGIMIEQLSEVCKNINDMKIIPIELFENVEKDI